MIIITGPGRSGTSVIAQVYARAGIDPGGVWEPSVRAGMEDPEIYALNRKILDALGLSTLGVKRPAPRIDDLRIPHRAKTRVKRLIKPHLRSRVRSAFESAIWNRSKSLSLLDWARIPELAQAYGTELREAASGRLVCKDPQFCWTLPVWLSAGAEIDHVVITHRRLDDMLESRRAAGHLHFRKYSDARNAMIYAFGNAVSVVTDSAVPHTVLRFPDFLGTPERLASTLPLPDERLRPALRRSLTDVVDAGMTSSSLGS